MQLYIGNKNYSSWSLRPWLALTHFGIAFEERKLRLGITADSPFKQALAAIVPTGKVPALVDDGFAVWDTLAIAEYLADKYPELPLWPRDRLQRARARSLCAEMHSSFGALRNHCPMNIEAHLPAVGARLLAEHANLQADVARINAAWQDALTRSGGPFLFGDFSLADAYFAPVVTRFRTYALPLSPAAQAYADHVWALPAMQQWVRDALAENDYLDFDEPYRSAEEVAASKA